jgi:hypothetical protein
MTRKFGLNRYGESDKAKAIRKLDVALSKLVRSRYGDQRHVANAENPSLRCHYLTSYLLGYWESNERFPVAIRPIFATPSAILPIRWHSSPCRCRADLRPSTIPNGYSSLSVMASAHWPSSRTVTPNSSPATVTRSTRSLNFAKQ